MFKSSFERTVEWGECDPADIVFYPQYFGMFDAATARLLENASGLPRARLIEKYDAVGWPIVDAKAVFHAPTSYDDRIRIDSRILCLGQSSFQIEHRLFRGDTLCVEVIETRVWANREASPRRIASSPIPDDLRTRLAAAHCPNGDLAAGKSADDAG